MATVSIPSSKLEKLKRKSAYSFAIGIDTGVHTGYAEWDCQNQCFTLIKTMKIHEAMFHVRQRVEYFRKNKMNYIIRVEDARQRTWFGTYSAKQDRDKLQGAGSVKRDSKIWDDFLSDLKANFVMVAPKNNATKMDAKTFKNLTGYVKVTSEHNRDAAMMVFGY